MSTPSPRPRHRKADAGEPEGTDVETAAEATEAEVIAADAREAAEFNTTEAAAEDLRTTAAPRPRRRKVRECGTPGCTPGTPATKPEDAPEQCAAHYDSRRGYVAGRED